MMWSRSFWVAGGVNPLVLPPSFGCSVVGSIVGSAMSLLLVDRAFNPLRVGVTPLVRGRSGGRAVLLEPLAGPFAVGVGHARARRVRPHRDRLAAPCRDGSALAVVVRRERCRGLGAVHGPAADEQVTEPGPALTGPGALPPGSGRVLDRRGHDRLPREVRDPALHTALDQRPQRRWS